MANKGVVQLMTVEEAAQVLSLSEKTVWKHIYAKRLGSTKIGGSRRIPMQCIQDFVDRGMQPAA